LHAGSSSTSCPGKNFLPSVSGSRGLSLVIARILANQSLRRVHESHKLLAMAIEVRLDGTEGKFLD
jgi:hypothetical protein